MAKYDVIYDYMSSETYTGNQKEIIQMAKKIGRMKCSQSIAIYHAGTHNVVGRWERKKSSNRWYEVF